ncbi:hypothetical protein LTR37_017215 [Vermiconidia calcicola]|uniref:Uncharacterized protein n=1 Tax=Vermiconidia calcicola TaxID=1690605 RepID=A0ACC3MNE1_9PEZI|nr:hypothetical protein LTR37_017215 [Vermiconidia calcicola]
MATMQLQKTRNDVARQHGNDSASEDEDAGARWHGEGSTPEDEKVARSLAWRRFNSSRRGNTAARSHGDDSTPVDEGTPPLARMATIRLRKTRNAGTITKTDKMEKKRLEVVQTVQTMLYGDASSIPLDSQASPPTPIGSNNLSMDQDAVTC